MSEDFILCLQACKEYREIITQLEQDCRNLRERVAVLASENAELKEKYERQTDSHN